MLQDEHIPLWALSVGVVVPLVAVVAVCVCGCKKTVPKNELLGLAGMVKITNPEENLNHNHQLNEGNTCTVVGSGRACVDATDRRTSSTVNRSLPAIPNDSERLRLEGGDPIWENEINGDTSSELYATVEENKHVIQPLGEHPYAQVRSTNPGAGESIPSEPGPSRVSLSRTEEAIATVSGNAPSSSSGDASANTNPIPPPRTRKSNSHSSLLAVAAATQLPGSVPDIPAATAIAGHISANQELPYMTPPIPSATNFSGDSQDSKGYTSISVREPLANIKAQTKASNQRSRAQELVDSHYATVSDDSDEMYAAIEEPSQVYTSGSETYAQIQPTPAPEPVPQPEPIPVSEGHHFPPQPPSVDSLKHVAQAHSRQASSSSATSSVANLGSPKPEKRQANSPLPPPPAGSPELYASADKKTLLLPSDGINLEEMYAKVMKKKQRIPETEAADDVSSAARTPVDGLSHVSVEMSSSRECLVRTRRDADRVSVCSNELTQDTKVDSGSCDTSPVQSNGELYCGYEKLHNSDSKHAREVHVSESGYESVGTHNSLVLKYDPGYEVVQQLQRNPSDADPNYEELRPQRTNTLAESTMDIHFAKNMSENDGEKGIQGGEKCSAIAFCSGKSDVSRTLSDGDPGYERVHSSVQNRSDSASIDKEAAVVFNDDSSEPNYESMPSEGPEHNYAGVMGATGGSESDPNYEMVEHEDPNYESVNYFEVNSDPPYERLRNEEVRDSDNDTVPGYEQVRHQASNSVVGYESFNKSADRLHQEKRSSEPGYEEVGGKTEDSSINVWAIGGESLHQNSNSSTVVLSSEMSSEQYDEHLYHLADGTDRLYSQIQKSHTKM